MGRIIFTIIMLLLYGGFSCFYSIDSFRASFIGLVPQLETVYVAMDEFFIKVWKVVFESWVSIDYIAHPNLPGTIIVGLAVLIIVLLVLLISSITHSSNKNRKIKLEENIKNELEKLESREAPSEFTHYDVNNVVFANEKTPLITLENELIVSSKSQEEKTQALLNAKKNKPLWRTIFSVLYCLVLIFIIFLRIVYHHHYSAEPSLAFLLQNETILFLFDNFDKFFDSLAGGLLGQPVFVLMEATWYAEEVIEYLFVFIIGILLLVAILLICHLILRKRRKRVNLKHKLNSIMTYEEGDISNKNLSFFGYADTRNVRGDVRTIAKLSNSEAKEMREKAMYKRASYIDDISEGVDERGVLNLGGFVIEPTVTRKPLEYEPLEEDLSMNENVTLDDIVSIDEKEDDTIVDKIESFVVPDEGVNYVDPTFIDVNVIAKTDENSKPDENLSDIDDTLVFDEDGYAYLVKEGKNFIDDEEDISDIIELDELDKTAIIDRFGENYYSLLNDLEPFHLHRLNYDEEMERINNAKYNGKLVEETKETYNELAKEEFASQEPVQEEVQEEVKEDTSNKLADPLEGVRKERPKIVPISIHKEEEKEEEPELVPVYEALEEINDLKSYIDTTVINKEEPVEKAEPIEPVVEETNEPIEEVTENEREKKILDPRRRGERPTITPIAIHHEDENESENVEETKPKRQLKPLSKPLDGPRKGRPDIVPISIHRKGEEPVEEEKEEASSVEEPIVQEVVSTEPIVESKEETTEEVTKTIVDPRAKERSEKSKITPVAIHKVISKPVEEVTSEPETREVEEQEETEPTKVKVITKVITRTIVDPRAAERSNKPKITPIPVHHISNEPVEEIKAYTDTEPIVENEEEIIEEVVPVTLQENIEPKEIKTYTDTERVETEENVEVVPISVEGIEESQDELNTYTETETEEVETTEEVEVVEDKEDERPRIVITRRPIKPIVPLRVKYKVEDEQEEEPVFNDEEIEEASPRIKDPLEGKRKRRPTITPIAIKIKREKPVEKKEPESDLPPKVKLVKFRKPHRRVWLEKDIKPVDLEGKRITNNSKLVYISKDDSLQGPVSPLEAFRKGITVAVPSYKPLLDKPEAPLTYKKTDYFEEDDTFIDDSLEDIFTEPELEVDKVKKVPLKRFRKHVEKPHRPLTKRKRTMSQLVKHSKPYDPVGIKKVDYSMFFKIEGDDEDE